MAPEEPTMRACVTLGFQLIDRIELMKEFCSCVRLLFFFQAEDGIRDLTVTGVQTCALPILDADRPCESGLREVFLPILDEEGEDVALLRGESFAVCHAEQRQGNLPIRLIVHRSEEHTSELQSQSNLVCRLLLEKKKRHNNTRSNQVDQNIADTHTSLTILANTRRHSLYGLNFRHTSSHHKLTRARALRRIDGLH